MSSNIKITTHDAKETLYQGIFPTLSDAISQAIQEHVILDRADLRGANLLNAALDNGSFRGARFDNANLQGANISEAQCDGVIFFNAALYNVCMCFSSLRGAMFDGASFGGTDMAGTTLDGAVFSTLSALALDFKATASLNDCLWMENDTTLIPFSRPPLVVTGLDVPLAVFDNHIKIGTLIMPHDEAQDFLAALRRGIRREERQTIAQRMDSRLFAFLSAHADTIAAVAGYKARQSIAPPLRTAATFAPR